MSATTPIVPNSESSRFRFGRNWQAFVSSVDANRIAMAEHSLLERFGLASLKGLSFLDVGCGSGLFSLAARRLGARVRSFDYDPESVACAEELKRKFLPAASEWIVEQGSVLDADYLATLERFDVVYCWGVLHHTGSMWRALNLLAALVEPRGFLLVALYNDQGRASAVWKLVKSSYNRLPRALRWMVLGPAIVRLWGPTTIRDLISGHPNRTWRTYSIQRGMSAWTDLLDWVGGYPFEVARRQAVAECCEALGYELIRLVSAGDGIGCNEFVFRRRA